MKAGISRSGRGEIATLTGRGRKLISIEDAVRAFRIDPAAAALRLSRWERQGWLRRVRRNLYIPVPIDAENPDTWTEDALYLADAVWHPCYFTGWTSANHWGLTEQVFRTTVLKTTRRVRRSKERLLDYDYLITHIRDRYLEWGMATVWREDRRLLMADSARTVIDVLDDPRLSGGIRNAADFLTAYLDDNDLGALIDYGARAGNATVFKRLGFLLETLGDARPEILAECRRRIASGITLLDPTAPASGRRIGKWGLRINVHVSPSDAS